MKKKKAYWILFILVIITLLLLSERTSGVFLHSIGPLTILCVITYGGYICCRWLLFWLGGVGKIDDGIDNSFKEWIEKNRKLPPK
jgi:hypothetical protein